MIRDGASYQAARRVRRLARAEGHLLGRFRASPDNGPDSRLGDVYVAECSLCGRAILLAFAPFDSERDEERAEMATSNRFGRLHDRRYVCSGLGRPCSAHAAGGVT
jgi:hypothetical protein